jgi:hypothetical protein
MAELQPVSNAERCVVARGTGSGNALDPEFNRTLRHASRIPGLAVAARRLT